MKHRSLFLPFLLLIPAVAHAQPSGGPYGPLPQTYEIPADAETVYHVAPDGDPEAGGNDPEAPTTIEEAISRVQTGDAIILRGGVYRTGELVLNQGVTLQPYGDERPVLKGTKLATEWEPLREGIWRTEWTALFPMAPQSWWRRHREGMYTPLHKFNNDMVFVDGRMLQSAGWEGELTEDNFFIDYRSGHVYLGFDPRGHTIEITAWDGGITRITGEAHGKTADRIGPTIRGLTFTQYAYRALEIEGMDPEGPMDAAAYGKDVVGTTLEHVTISHTSRVAAYLRGDRVAVRHCLISDTSTEGLYIFASSDSVFERNIFRRNNIEGITGYYPAALKIFNQTNRVLVRENLVTDNRNSSGIWYDVGNNDGVFVNNWLEETRDGFFFEISQRAICAGNVFIDCLRGIRVLNSADVRIYHNTFLDADVAIERTSRSAVGDHFGWHPATGPGMEERDGHEFGNNLLLANTDFPRPLLYFGQEPELRDRLTEPQVSRMDGNVYVREATGERPLLAQIEGDPIRPGPDDHRVTYTTLDDFRADFDNAFEGNGKGFGDHRGPVVRSRTLRHLELLERFPLGEYAPVETPADVLEALDWQAGEATLPGAYQKLAGGT